MATSVNESSFISHTEDAMTAMFWILLVVVQNAIYTMDK